MIDEDNIRDDERLRCVLFSIRRSCSISRRKQSDQDAASRFGETPAGRGHRSIIQYIAIRQLRFMAVTGDGRWTSSVVVLLIVPSLLINKRKINEGSGSVYSSCCQSRVTQIRFISTRRRRSRILITMLAHLRPDPSAVAVSRIRRICYCRRKSAEK